MQHLQVHRLMAQLRPTQERGRHTLQGGERPCWRRHRRLHALQQYLCQVGHSED